MPCVSTQSFPAANFDASADQHVLLFGDSKAGGLNARGSVSKLPLRTGRALPPEKHRTGAVENTVDLHSTAGIELKLSLKFRLACLRNDEDSLRRGEALDIEGCDGASVRWPVSDCELRYVSVYESAADSRLA